MRFWQLILIAAVCEMQAAVSILEERNGTNIEENKKLYQHLERGKGHLCYQ
ncbi:TPA: hypothetical protein ACKOR7_001040 [Clostridioides difficile]